MKKNIAHLIILLLLSGAAKAQEAVAQAVMNADGSRQINITDASGKTTKISAADDVGLRAKYLDLMKQQAAANATTTGAEQKDKIISHRAVIGADRKQQIIVTFASGKEKAINAVEGQTIQETYLAYLQKAGLECGCSPVAAPANSEGSTHTATRGSAPADN
jgi:hypothetical protein